jgi:hypothetical protein
MYGTVRTGWVQSEETDVVDTRTFPWSRKREVTPIFKRRYTGPRANRLDKSCLNSSTQLLDRFLILPEADPREQNLGGQTKAAEALKD